MTNISDVIYRADGSPAGGVLLISWPAFTTSGGAAVQDVKSLGIAGFHNLTQQQISDQVNAPIFKSSVWGVPYGFFYHNQELTTADAITNRQIVDEVKFKDGLSKIIDGTVECLNTSIWAKAGQP